MLYTVTATFSDFTNAVEQFDTHSPESAARLFIERAVSMADYDRRAWHRLAPENVRLIHLANGLRGTWIWSSATTLEHDEIGMLGGVIVQTDTAGPVRPPIA